MLFTKPIKKGNAEELIINGEKLSAITDAAEIITTGVEGRDGYQADLDIMDDIDGREGGILLDYRLPPRTLTVHFLLRAKSPEGYRRAFNALAEEMAKYRTPTSIAFSDEPEWAYYGVLQEFSTPSPGRLSVEGALSFVCPDPYKYGPKTGIPPDHQVTMPGIPFPLYADEITLRPGEAKEATVKNLTTGKRIRVLVSTTKADTVTIRGKIYKNAEPVTRYIDYTVSDIHGFLLHSGDRIQAESGTVALAYRERRL